mgnify:CR=1 FL=1
MLKIRISIFIIFTAIVIYPLAGSQFDIDKTKVKTKLLSFMVTHFSDGYEIPWGMAFLPDHRMLVNDISGKMWLLSKDGKTKTNIKGIPPVFFHGQGGLLDVEVHPDFLNNSLVYISYSEELDRNRYQTTLIRGTLKKNTFENIEIVFRANEIDFSRTSHHYGSRIVFDDDKFLYFSIGDRGFKEQAQDLTSPSGKIHRVLGDGTIPLDNPFINIKNAYQSIWTFGNRNPQGLAKHPKTGLIWESEHGPRGGDELNLIQKGHNYGWPVITYGINYDGSKITDLKVKKGMDQPKKYWTPSIAVCGIKFYTGEPFKAWENNLLVTSLKYEQLRRLIIINNKKIDEEIIFESGSRIRDVEVGWDGLIYIALENPGRIVRLSPLRN